MGSGKNRWRINFYRSPASLKPTIKQPPKEFVCSISGSLMADPVIVASGQTFERNCVQVCKNLGFTPVLSDESKPDLSTVIPNIAIKSMILNWCDCYSVDRPKPLEFGVAEKIVRTLMASQQEKSSNENRSEEEGKIEVSEEELFKTAAERYPLKFSYEINELNRQPIHCYSSSEESVTVTNPTSPLAVAISRPPCYSSSSSSEITADETINPNSSLEDEEEKEIFVKLKSSQVSDQEEAVTSLRKITKTNQEIRIPLCTPRLLSALRSLLMSRYSSIQINAVAALVNLSLEKINKVKIVRSSFVPPLIDLLKGGFPESKEHAASAIFSLAIEDENKTAIGVLGALPPLLHLLRSEGERVRHDSAFALYHLSLVQSNQSKLVKLGAIPILLAMTKRRDLTNRVLLILRNIAAGSEGRAAMLDAGAVKCFTEMLRERGSEPDSDMTRESCVEALQALSCGSLRFRGLAKEAGAAEVLKEVVAVRGSERAREKAKKVLEMVKGRDGEEEEEEVAVVDWESLLDSGVVSRSRYAICCQKNEKEVN